MQPEINVLGVSIKTFGVCFALAFIAAGATVQRRLVELGKSGEWAYEMVFAAVVGGLVGSRLYYLIQNYDEVKNDLFGNIFSGAGLVWYGGLIGGAIGVCLWAWRRDFLGLTLLDVCAPALAIGYAIGRIGGEVPTTQRVHPTPVYETLASLLIFAVLWRLRERVSAGRLFAIYLLLAGLERFLVEFLRRNNHVALGLTAPQLESLAMMVAGLVWIGLAARRGSIRAVSAYAPTS